MYLLRLIRRLIGLGLVIFLTTLAFVVVFASMQSLTEPETFRPASRIVVLGGGTKPDGTLHISSKRRVEKGVILYKAGTAPMLHFTGGLPHQGGVSIGAQMAAYAQKLGVPKAAITSEDKSQSTLQNALFSASELKNDKRIILVTDGFHLPRSWVSMRLFGSYDIALAHSVAHPHLNLEARMFRIRMYLRETLAIWFNAARYLVWRMAPLWGMNGLERDKLLY